MESNHVKKPSTLTFTCILIWWESVATRKGLSLFFLDITGTPLNVAP